MQMLIDVHGRERENDMLQDNSIQMYRVCMSGLISSIPLGGGEGGKGVEGWKRMVRRMLKAINFASSSSWG